MRTSSTRSEPASRWKSSAGALLTIGWTVSAVLTAGCATTAKEPLLTLQQRQLNVESFDYVWTTVRDKYWDPELGGLDWPAVRDELRPRVEQAAHMADARALMNDLVSRLGVSHFAVFPAEVYDELGGPAGEGPRDGSVGIDVRVIDGQALVTQVVAGSPADHAGVQRGWVLARINDADVSAKLAMLAREFADKPYRDWVLVTSVRNRLSGRVGNAVTIEFLDGRDALVQLELTLAEQRGWKTQFGHLPPTWVWIDTNMLEGNIGYIAFNGFLNPTQLMPVFNDALQRFMEADGLIIDLRGNGGGLGGMAMGMAGWLVADKSHYLGTVYLRNSELKLIVFPRPKTYDGPVAVLVDGLSASAAEFFAGGLKDLGRAHIVGSRTVGAALASAFERLPNGDGFQYVLANYVSRGGEPLEGAGVVPDIKVCHTREALLEGRDLLLQAAVDWIEGQQ